MSNYGFVICNDDPYVGVSQCCFVMSAIVSCVDIEAHYAQSVQYVDTIWTWYQQPIITVPFLLHNEYLEICLFIPVFKWRVNPFKWRVKPFLFYVPPNFILHVELASVVLHQLCQHHLWQPPYTQIAPKCHCLLFNETISVRFSTLLEILSNKIVLSFLCNESSDMS